MVIASFEKEVRSGFSRAVFVGDRLVELSGQTAFRDWLVLPNQFDYIADGDLIDRHILNVRSDAPVGYSRCPLD